MSLKTVGIKSVDETFKTATQPLREGTNLRDSVLVALSSFRLNCGLGQTSNIKQCLRMLASRLQSSGENVTLQQSVKDEVMVLPPGGIAYYYLCIIYIFFTGNCDGINIFIYLYVFFLTVITYSFLF